VSLLTETLDAVRALTALLAEETEALTARRRGPELKAFADGKALLADRIADLTEAAKRAGRPALVAEPPALRAAVAEAMVALQAALAANARILERRKALSEGLIDAVLVEAKRQAGTQLAGYGRASGRGDRAAAIAYNARA
jgi:hypothetical protein